MPNFGLIGLIKLGLGWKSLELAVKISVNRDENGAMCQISAWLVEFKWCLSCKAAIKLLKLAVNSCLNSLTLKS